MPCIDVRKRRSELVSRVAESSLICPICKGSSVRFVRNLTRSHDLLSCLSCRAKYGFPFVSLGSEFYTSATDLASETRHCGANTFGSHPVKESALFENGNNKWLLDIGCGNGAFAEFAASVGYNVVGLDVDTKSIQVARSRCIRNAEFYVCDLDQFYSLGALTRSFDVVSMFEVFEHLENPFQTLLYVKRFLREGGAFIGSLPNTNRPLMWYFHMDYEMPPYHLTYWTVEEWRFFLRQYFNFELSYVKPNYHYGYVGAAIYYSRLPAIIRKGIARVVLPIEMRLEKRFELGASFYFEAKKLEIVTESVE